MSEDLPESGGHGGGLPERDELACSDRKEFELMSRAIVNRWPETSIGENAETRRKVVETLAKVRNPRNIAMLTKLLVLMEGQKQTDDWNADKNDRLDQGKATDRVAVDPVVLERPVQPPNVLGSEKR